MSYITVVDENEYTLIEKKSEFIARVKRVTTEDEAKDFIYKISKKSKGARHNVYAYVIGENSHIIRYSDDGEPSGTAGMPTLNIIEKNNLKDVIIVITRYFGGILLGASGLTRAYSNAAKGVIELAKKVQIVSGTKLTFNLPYDIHSKITNNLKEDNIQVINAIYTDYVTLEILTLTSKVEGLINKYYDITNGKLNSQVLSENKYFLDEEGNLIEIN